MANHCSLFLIDILIIFSYHTLHLYFLPLNNSFTRALCFLYFLLCFFSPLLTIFLQYLPGSPFHLINSLCLISVLFLISQFQLQSTVINTDILKFSNSSYSSNYCTEILLLLFHFPEFTLIQNYSLLTPFPYFPIF